MKVLAIIPARYASSRFPGKPLADLGGMPVVEWVYRGVSEINIIDEACVATDDDRIASAVMAFGGNCVMTSANHKSGTERCAEVVEKLEAQGKQFDIVLNVQGDEPFVNKKQITTLLDLFANKNTEIATLAKSIDSKEELLSPNNVKVVVSQHGNALYFSRTPIPYIRDCDSQSWLSAHKYLKHVGIYAYRTLILKKIVKLEETPLEHCEKLEQLRWLENGFMMSVAITVCENIGIDTPEDLQKAREIIKHR